MTTSIGSPKGADCRLDREGTAAGRARRTSTQARGATKSLGTIGPPRSMAHLAPAADRLREIEGVHPDSRASPPIGRRSRRTSVGSDLLVHGGAAGSPAAGAGGAPARG